VKRLKEGSVIRLQRSAVAFSPVVHPLRTTRHGPLIPRGAQLAYVGPSPCRPGMHLAEPPDQAIGVRWEVPSRQDELAAQQELPPFS
jgi:hypothetical protein